MRYDRFGDMVLATGTIEAIARAQPTVTVDVLASHLNAEVLRGNPAVGGVITVDKSRVFSILKALARVRLARYDAVIDTMVVAPSLTTTLFMWASGAPHRIGVGGRGNDFALTFCAPPVPNALHYVDRSAALLTAFGVDVEPIAAQAAAPRLAPVAHADPSGATRSSPGWGIWMPRIFLTPDELHQGEERWRAAEAGASCDPVTVRRLVVNVSAGRDWRCWPEDRFLPILAMLRERFPHVSILVVGAPEDADCMERVGRSAGVPVAHTPRWREMAAIVATCHFAFTADTSVTHVASAFGKPAVALYARDGGDLYGPYGTAGMVVSTAAASLHFLSVDAAWQALETMIAADQPHARRHLARAAG
jgi:ADP-heptose:LPS heptosyltransferase